MAGVNEGQLSFETIRRGTSSTAICSRKCVNIHGSLSFLHELVWPKHALDQSILYSSTISSQNMGFYACFTAAALAMAASAASTVSGQSCSNKRG